jgi:hypothetical protein
MGEQDCGVTMSVSSMSMVETNQLGSLAML